MKVGKVPEAVLKRSVLNQLKNRKEEVLYGPKVGEDCCVLNWAPDTLMVISTDPITGTTKDIGTLAVHVTANDIAASGGTVIGILVTLLLPENTKEETLKEIMEEIKEVCEKLEIDLLGGHTEVTRAVIQPVISITGVGKVTKDTLTLSSGLEPEDDLVVTKWVGLEGTCLLAKEKESILQGQMKQSLIEEAKKYDQLLSVIPESKVAIQHGVKAMHDITEGGIYGALWEMASSANVGFEVDIDAIPIKRATIEIGECLAINPYQLMGSGAMLIGTKNGKTLVEKLELAGIHSQVIGKVTKGKQRLIVGDQIRRTLKPPKSDELYQIIK